MSYENILTKLFLYNFLSLVRQKHVFHYNTLSKPFYISLSNVFIIINRYSNILLLVEVEQTKLVSHKNE